MVTRPNTTCEILTEASKDLDRTPTIAADSGVENVNAGVDQLIADGFVHRVLAQVEVSFSNSMVEAPTSGSSDSLNNP